MDSIDILGTTIYDAKTLVLEKGSPWEGYTYTGQVNSKNEPHGLGKIVLNDILVQIGSWEDGLICGYGVAYTIDGDYLCKGVWEKGAHSPIEEKEVVQPSPQNTVEEYTTSPSLLSGLFNYASKKYGITKTHIFRKDGLLKTKDQKLPLDKSGTPSCDDDWIWGDVTIKGEPGESDITWEGVFMPKAKRDRIEKAQEAYKDFLKNNNSSNLTP